MQWNERHRRKLYRMIEDKWSSLDIKSFEQFLADLGIKWAELEDEVRDAPPGTIAIWEGPGFADELKKECWVIPDDVAMRMLALGIP